MQNHLFDTENSVLKQQLVELRTQAQLTQRELSVQLGRPQSYVSKYESGERKLTLIEIRNIAICCGTTLVDFVNNFEEELKLVDN